MSGSPFGKYLLYERIAAGGMAEIYRAKYVAAAGVTKSVVIKKILPHYAGNRNFVSMFINEAKIVVGLSHGNIAQVFDFGEIDGEYFLAMEYVHGQTVSRILRRAKEKGLRLPAPYAVFIAIEVSRGLHYAHTRVDEQHRPLGIVHRDISPQNVIVSYEGQVKLVDFGIAKARSASDADKTQAGAIKGKYVYFSPEQARARELDGRSDVFATGIVLYEMVCGRLPFEGKMVEVLNKIVRGEYPRPSVVNPEVDPKLEKVIARALSTQRDDRYASSLAFQEALTEYLIAVAPRFNQSNLAELVDYLFAEELAEEGHEVQISQSFAEKIERWRDAEVTRAPPLPMADPDDVAEITSAERLSARRSAAHTIESGAVVDPAPRHTRSAFKGGKRGTLVMAGAAVLAAAAGGGAMVLFGRPTGFAVRVESHPPGVEIKLDGAPTARRTPTTFTDLDGARPHMVELDAPGMNPWIKQVRPVRGQTVSVVATLVPRALGPAGASSAAVDLQARDELPARGPAPEARGPNANLRFDARTAALSIPASRAARTRLDPRQRYTLRVEGTAKLDDVTRTQGCFYFVEREAGAAGPAFGWLGPGDTAAVSKVRVLYGFVVDPTPADNTGALTLIAQSGGRERRLTVDAQASAVFPDPTRGARFTGLGGRGSLALTLQGRVDLGAGAGPGQEAVYWYDGTVDLAELAEHPDLTHGVIRAGVPLELQNPSRAVLFIPDDDPGDDQGAMDARVGPASAR